MKITITIQNEPPADTLDCIIQSDDSTMPFAKVVSMLETITEDFFKDYMKAVKREIGVSDSSPDELERIAMTMPMPEMTRSIDLSIPKQPSE